jgi:DnaK suppressor protein
MQQQKTADYREALIDLRRDSRRDLQQRDRAIAEDVGSGAAASDDPTHPADQDSEGLVEEVELARLERSIYHRVEAALQRIADGRFGICEDCGTEISRERLDALPYAETCASCAAARESAEPR